MYVRKIIFCFLFFLFSWLFLSPLFLRCEYPDLCSDGGESAVVARAEVDIGAVYKVVLVHVHSLGIGGLLPLLAYPPAGAWAPKPYPLIILFGGDDASAAARPSSSSSGDGTLE